MILPILLQPNYNFLSFKGKVGKIFATSPMICMPRGQLHPLRLQGQQGQVPFPEWFQEYNQGIL